jgi:hypothetical protein
VSDIGGLLKIQGDRICQQTLSTLDFIMSRARGWPMAITFPRSTVLEGQWKGQRLVIMSSSKDIMVEVGMIRTQIRLTEDQVKALKRLAAAEERPMAELIRRSVDSFLKVNVHGGPKERKRRALAVIGRFRSGVSDLSVGHDHYLDEAFEDERLR